MGTWSIPLDKLAAKAGADIERVGRKVTFELFNALQLRSPVDTGRFRGNWQISSGAPASGVMPTTDQSGTGAAAEAAKALTIPLGGTVYFVNNLPYAQRLEYGWSQQAPQGMVRLTMREFRGYVQRALKS